MMKKVFKVLYICLIIIFILSYFKTKQLPKIYDIDFSLYNQPVQKDTTRKEFSFSYRGKEYIVEPVADYELWGLIVSKNNINAWYNFYHDKDTVNLKDICVVWDKNIKNGTYKDKNISFTSGEWTCYVKPSSKFKNIFHPNNLSNNHLLAKDIAVQELIRDLNIGDQVYLKGNLINYKENGIPYVRSTSLSREDRSCEIIHVDEIKILKKNKESWHLINEISKKALFSLIVIHLMISVIRTKQKLLEIYHRRRKSD